MTNFIEAINEAARVSLPGDVDIHNLRQMSAHELCLTYGLKPTKAASVVAVLRAATAVAHATVSSTRVSVTNSTEAYAHFKFLETSSVEKFCVLLLNRRNQVIRLVEIHRGGLAAMAVDPKVIFHTAIEHRASCLILAHNHPSGAPAPSIEDINLTKKVVAAGLMLDLPVIDHIIVGDNCFHSLADNGQM